MRQKLKYVIEKGLFEIREKELVQSCKVENDLSSNMADKMMALFENHEVNILMSFYVLIF